MRLFLKLLACVIVAYGLAAYMTIPASPEIRFWQHVVELRDAEIAQVRAEKPGTPIIFFTGGSSCAFSIDPKIVEETCGLPAFNLGLPVSAGPKFLLHQALEKCRKGDILVISLEPDALTYPSDFAPTTLTFGLAVLAGSPSATVGGSSFGEHISIRDCLNYSRPGPGYVTTWLAKSATGKGYRYENKDIRYHGRIETSVSDPSLPLAGHKQVDRICQSGHEFLTTFQKAAAAKGVQLVYSMPWMLTAKDAAPENRAANLKILESIKPILPAIDDGHQGVATDPKLFSDSGQHLSAAGSKIRSSALANALQAWLKIH